MMSIHTSRSDLPPALILILAMLALVISLDSMWSRKLANPDEGRYSVIAREMAATNDFVTPRLNGIKYFYKPPMQYWASAIAIKLFGENEFSARLYTKVAGLGCVLIMLFVGYRLYNLETGLLAAMVMLASPYFGGMTEVVTLDTGLTFWMTLGVGAFLLSQHAVDDRARRRWLWLAWVGMAGAVLSKGLIGFVFPAAAIFLYGLVNRDFRLWLRLEWLVGLIIFFAITAPWFILVSLQNPEFPHFFFIHEHFDRFLTDEHRRTEPWHFFIPVLLLGALPWLVSLFPAVWNGFREPGQLAGSNARVFQPLKFVLIFSIFIFLFFSKSNSKLPAYILIFFPVLALVVARYLHDVEARTLSWQLVPTALFALVGIYAAYVAPARRARGEFSLALYQDMSMWLMIGAGILAWGTLAAIFLLRQNRKWPALVAVTFSSMLFIAAVERGYDKLSPQQSGYDLAQAIQPQLDRDANTRLYFVRTYDQTLPFYLKRTITLVEYVDEFEMGQRREPQKVIAKLDDFPATWNAPGAAIAIIEPHMIEKIRGMGFNFRVIYENPRRMAILKE
jgi:4-amino-4-deoxy-L-arabinose transferase-like glycosyltransferase